MALDDAPTLRRILHKFWDMSLDAEVLAATGVTILFAEVQPWVAARVQARAELLKERWADTLRTATARGVSWEANTQDTFRGLGHRNFMQVVDLLGSFLRVARLEDKTLQYRYLALQLALRGFDSPESLEGLETADIAEVLKTPWDTTVLQRAITAATELGVKRRIRVAATLAEQSVTRVSQNTARAELILEELDPKQLDAGWEKVVKQLDRVLQQSNDAKPMEMVRAASRAAQSGFPVAELLQQKQALTMLESRRASLGSIRSTLKAWHFFALCVLGYAEELFTLPPLQSEHVRCWGELFKNKNTAITYITNLAWCCRLVGASTAWQDDTLKVWIAGARKKDLRTGVLQSVVQFVLSWEMVMQLVSYFDSQLLFEFSMATLFYWFFLCRVQSEGIVVVKGNPNFVDEIPAGVNNAAWVAGRWAHFRLRKRKHRPRGSWLKQCCSCNGDSTASQWCLVCRLKP